VLLSADDGKPSAVRATDLRAHAGAIVFPAEVAESGAVTVPGRGLFSGYLGNLPAGLLELTGSPGPRASVKAERSNYDFPRASRPDEGIPPLPTATERGQSSRSGAKRFREGGRRGRFFAGRERGGRGGAVLMGPGLLELDGEKYHPWVATDPA